MLFRYLLTILPTEALSAEVDRMRGLLHTQIGSFTGRNTPPHITLFFADLPAECEGEVCEGIAQGATGLNGFTLHYNGITHFPDKRTIYIDPVEKDAIAVVRVPIVAALKANNTLRDAIRETDHPHLTIAADLKPSQFDKSWEILAPHEHVSAEQVNEILLLKRLLKPGEHYKTVRRFLLEG